MRLVKTQLPSSEPVSLADAKQFARIDITEDDDLVNYLISQARAAVEDYCNIALLTQNFSVFYDFKDGTEGIWRLKRAIRLPMFPIQNIAAITTFDPTNTGTVFDSSDYFQSGQRIALNDQITWPENLRLIDSMQIDFVAGYPSEDLIPPPIFVAIKQLITQWYENRQVFTEPDGMSNTAATVLPMPFTVKAILSPYRQIYL